MGLSPFRTGTARTAFQLPPPIYPFRIVIIIIGMVDVRVLSDLHVSEKKGAMAVLMVCCIGLRVLYRSAGAAET